MTPLSPQIDIRRRRTVLIFEIVLIMTLVASVALMAGLMAGLNWQKCLMLMVVSAILAGSITFTVLEMYRAANVKKERAAAADAAAIEAFEASLAIQRAKAERRLPPERNEPYRHHEHHLESPGFDQGQLTSQLSGSTPFFEHLEHERVEQLEQEVVPRKRTKRKAVS